MFKKHPFWALTVGLLSIFLWQSCSKSEDTPEDSENPEISTEPVELQAAKILYQDYYLGSILSGSDDAWSGGDVSQCVMGSVPNGTVEKTMRRIEYYRRAVGLTEAIAMNAEKSEKAQAAALMMDANNRLDHFPTSDWSCYTEDGREGAGSSLLTTAQGPSAIDSYMRDAGSVNSHAGHRRWLLYPRLGEIGLGNTAGANAIWVLGNHVARPDNAPEFISWPPQGYAPNNLIFDRWSFSVAGADFSGATVAMQDESGNSISVQLEPVDNQFGDRTLVWVPQNIDKNVGDPRPRYTVDIIDVNIDGVLQDFSYEVILFNPNE